MLAWMIRMLTVALALSPALAQLETSADLDGQAIRAQEELDAIQKRIDDGELPKIQFDLDSARIRREAEGALDLVAQVLLKNPRLKMRLTAHTCNLGSHEYNLQLSRARARAVKDALVRRGVPPPSIRFYGKSFDEPIADNDTEEGRERNRRVEFHIIRRDWSSIY